MWMVEYRPEVPADIRSAREWYDSKVAGLGEAFEHEVLRAIDRILSNPEQYALATNGLRQCRVHRFSYVIHYRLHGRTILIIAVLSGYQDDSQATSRITNG